MSGDRPRPLDDELVGEAVRAAARESGQEAGRVVVVPRTGSTSSDLVAAAATSSEAWPDRSVYVTDHQEAGRGRSGRTWTTPAGAALTVSVLLRPSMAPERLGWAPLVAGLAVVQAIDDVAGVRASLKWPNDVLLDATDGRDLPGWGRRRKVAGVLAEMVAHGVVVGVGVNVSQAAHELPVPSATSLAVVRGGAGEADLRPELLRALLTRWWSADARWRAADGDAWAAGIGAAVTAACATIGQEVAVDLPGGEELRGTATGLSPDGALEVLGEDGRRRTVLAGDVRHVRAVAGG